MQMNVSPEKLMRRLGCREIPQDKPSSPKRWSCPLHPDGDGGLTASHGPRSVFSCSSPLCRFRGDAAALVSMARGVSIEEAVRLFMAGGELEECVEDEPLSEEDVEAYLESANSQAAIQAYLAKCSMELRKNPEKAGVRTGMSRASLRLLHPEVGLFVEDGAPNCLREFLKQKYRGATLLLYPYRMNGEVTRIDVLDSGDPSFRHQAVVTHPTAGVFGETCAGLQGRVVAVERPEDAARLYAIYAIGTTRPPPVVAFRGYPLPECFRDVDNVDILSAKGSEATTGFLLRALCAPEIKSGRNPVVRAVVCSERVQNLKYDDIRDMYGCRLFRYHDIQHLLAKRMSRMVSDGKSKDVMDLLAAEQAPAIARNMLKVAAETQTELRGGFGFDPDASRKLAELLSSSQAAKPCDMYLANGRAIHCGPDGVFAMLKSGAVEALCNVGISVDARIVDPGKRGEAFECTVSARGGFPAVKVKLDWRDVSYDRLREAIQSAYSELGLSPYVAFYPFPGYAWKDIIARLAENCPVERRRPVEFKKRVSSGTMRIGSVLKGKEDERHRDTPCNKAR